MKKFFMMFAVAMMTLVAATTMVSCGSDDSKKEEIEGASLRTSVAINDPEDELTMQQKADLQSTLSIIGNINHLYTTDAAGLQKELLAWQKRFNTKIKEHLDKNPSLRNTKAGLTVTYVGGSETTKDIVIFATFNPTNLE